MAEYIDRDQLTIHDGWLDDGNGETHTHIQFVYANEIYQQPTADVQEVKHAHWIPKRLGTCECSNCSEDYEVCGGLLGDYNYCPNCGAKMDKE